MSGSNVTVIEGEKVSYEISTFKNEVQISVWVHYEVVNHKVVVTSKSISFDPWNKQLNCVAERPKDWHYFALTPSEAKREFDKWAKKYKPELIGSFTTQHFQELIQNRVRAAQHIEDKKYFKERAAAFKKDLKKLMDKYGVGIEVYTSDGYGSVDLYDNTLDSHGSDFEETLVDLEDANEHSVQLLGE